MKKLTAMLLVVAIIVTTCLITAFAAGGTQDGIEMTLTTDKAEYAAGESITATLTVTNTNHFTVSSVNLESRIPEGYQLAQDSEAARQITALNAGESASLTVTYAGNSTSDNENNSSDTNTQNPGSGEDSSQTPPEDGSGTPSDSGTIANASDGGTVQNARETQQSGPETAEENQEVVRSPKTGDTQNIVLYIALLVLAAAGIMAVLTAGKRKRSTILSILLCAGMLVPLAASLPAYAAETAQSAEVSTVVKADNQDITIEARVSYTLPDNTDSGNDDNTTEGKKVLVAYFSATNTTERLAGYLADGIGADLYEITPEIPYTSADLNYGDSSSRTSIEMNDPNARPEISGSVENMEQYKIVFIGYPNMEQGFNSVLCA